VYNSGVDRMRYQQRVREARPAWRIAHDDEIRFRRATAAKGRSRARWADDTARPDQQRRRRRLRLVD